MVRANHGVGLGASDKATRKVKSTSGGALCVVGVRGEEEAYSGARRLTKQVIKLNREFGDFL